MKLTPLLAASLIMVSALQAATYTFVTSTNAVLVLGTTDIGNHCDDCTTTISLPFSYMLYGTLYNTVVVSSNGNLQFTGNTNYLGSSPLFNTNLGISILGYQDDLWTAAVGDGIFTSLSGVGPNQIFNIEWRNISDAREARIGRYGCIKASRDSISSMRTPPITAVMKRLGFRKMPAILLSSPATPPVSRLA